MQHTPYNIKYQYDIKGELQELKYEPTIADVKARFEEMVENLHAHIDGLTKANHEAEIVAKLTISKIPSGYEATAGVWIDGNKHEIITHTNSGDIISLIANLRKSLSNEIAHNKSHNA